MVPKNEQHLANFKHPNTMICNSKLYADNGTKPIGSENIKFSKVWKAKHRRLIAIDDNKILHYWSDYKYQKSLVNCEINVKSAAFGLGCVFVVDEKGMPYMFNPPGPHIIELSHTHPVPFVDVKFYRGHLVYLDALGTVCTYKFTITQKSTGKLDGCCLIRLKYPVVSIQTTRSGLYLLDKSNDLYEGKTKLESNVKMMVCTRDNVVIIKPTENLQEEILIGRLKWSHCQNFQKISSHPEYTQIGTSKNILYVLCQGMILLKIKLDDEIRTLGVNKFEYNTFSLSNEFYYYDNIMMKSAATHI